MSEPVPTSKPYLVLVAKHGTEVDITPLSRLLGPSRMDRVSEALVSHLDRSAKRTCQGRASNFEKFSVWVAAKWRMRPIDGVVDDLTAETFRIELQSVVSAWGEAEKARTDVAETTIGETVNAVGGILDALSTHGVLPKVVRPRMRRNYHRTKGRRKSFAELTPDRLKAPDETIVSALKQELRTIAEIDDSDDFLRALVSTFGPRRLDSVSEIIAAIKTVNRGRLTRLRELAEEDFLHNHALYLEGQEMRRRPAADFNEYLELVTGLAGKAKQIASKRWYQANGWMDQTLLAASFLQYVYKYCDGIVPTEVNFAGGKLLFTHLMRKLGGKAKVECWVGAGSACVSAVALLYLIDTGANPSVALSLTLDWEQESEIPGHKKVAGVKSRPRPKGILDDLPVKDPSVRVTSIQALRALTVMCQNYRMSSPELKNVLFVHNFFEPKQLTNETLCDRLNYLCRRDPVLAKLRMTPAQIRSSFLLNSTLTSNGQVALQQALAQHSPGNGVTEGYTMVFPTRLIYAQKIREFQDVLQFDVLSNVEGAISALKLRRPDLRASTKTARHTGLGHTCLNAEAGIQPGSSEGIVCTAIDRCLGCEMMAYVVTPENLADTLLLREYLAENRKEWETSREARWNAVWGPYLAFCEVVIEKVKRSRYAYLLKVAAEIHAEMRGDGRTPIPIF